LANRKLVAVTKDEQIGYWRDLARKNWAEAHRMAKRAGWSTFGAHTDQPDLILEFEGVAEDGLPIWERPA
jgi:hypothetical protein